MKETIIIKTEIVLSGKELLDKLGLPKELTIKNVCFADNEEVKISFADKTVKSER